MITLLCLVSLVLGAIISVAAGARLKNENERATLESVFFTMSVLLISLLSYVFTIIGLIGIYLFFTDLLFDVNTMSIALGYIMLFITFLFCTFFTYLGNKSGDEPKENG